MNLNRRITWLMQRSHRADGSRLGVRREGSSVLVANGPSRRQRPVDEIAALVPVDAVARVEKGGVPITVHGQQTGLGQLVGHLDGVLVGSGRVIGIPYDQH